jgi:hypothetical protein
MYMIYLHTKFHIPNSNGPLVTAMKLKAGHKFRVNATLYILQQITVKQSWLFLANYNTEFQNPN